MASFSTSRRDRDAHRRVQVLRQPPRHGPGHHPLRARLEADDLHGLEAADGFAQGLELEHQPAHALDARMAAAISRLPALRRSPLSTTHLLLLGHHPDVTADVTNHRVELWRNPA